MRATITPSRAAVELQRLGLDQAAVARQAGCSRAYVGLQLAGERRLTADLLAALDRLAGPAGAQRVVRSIPTSTQET